MMKKREEISIDNKTTDKKNERIVIRESNLKIRNNHHNAAILLLLVIFGCSLNISITTTAFVLPSATTSRIHYNNRYTEQQRESDDTTASARPLLFRSPGQTQNQRISTTSKSSSSTALMGIPKMFRWLTDQYPNIARQLQEGLNSDKYNDIDNFYLDMNGIIHPCTHGNADGKIIILNEGEMFKKIFMYVDRLYKLVKPRKLLYLAVDGVAPRAKMNQQRSRRFRSAKEAEEIMSNLVAQNKGDIPLGAERFDSNCITPGTDFMLKLNLAMTKWVEYKMETDPFWKNLGTDIVVSGPDVPGEGEHKVMDYIREQKNLYYSTNISKEDKIKLHWSPEQTHVLYGLDADLIMLGLVTHEPNFMLLREKMSVVMAGRGRNKREKKKDMLEYNQYDFEVLELKQLRRLLTVQFRQFADDNQDSNTPYQLKNFDIERIIDDFVFVCMLVGNDFLPHCPHLEIDGGAISLMLTTYTDLLGEWKDYLTKKEKIHPQRLEQFLYHISVYEEEHFKRRGYDENEPGWQLSSNNELNQYDNYDFYGTYYTGTKTPLCAMRGNRKLSITERGSNNEHSNGNDNKEVSPSSDESLNKDDEEFFSGMSLGNNVDSGIDEFNIMLDKKEFKRKHPYDMSRSYRDYYYETKLGWSPLKEDRNTTLLQRRAHVRDYIEGLHWNLNYYHNGCSSWDWYFPHLYAPLCTDMVNINEFYDDSDQDCIDDEGYKTFPFHKGEAIPSLAQLLSVLPPQSAQLLPKTFSELMIEPSSPLKEYYPNDFTTDPNGKRQPWEAVVQIPFIDSKTLMNTVQQIFDLDEKITKYNTKIQKESNEDDNDSDVVLKKPLLSNAERRRNVRGQSYTFYNKNRNNNNGPTVVNGSSSIDGRRKVQKSSSTKKKKTGSSKKKKSTTKKKKKSTTKTKSNTA